MNRASRPAIVERALVVAGLAFFLVWTTHGDLTRPLPGGQVLALALLAGLAAALVVARVALAVSGPQARAWLASARAPAVLLAVAFVAAAPRVFAAQGPPDYPALERQALVESHRMLTTGNYRPTTFERPSALLYAQTAAGGALFLGGVYIDRWREVKAVQPQDLALVARLLNAGFALATAFLLVVVGGQRDARAGWFAALLFALSPLAWTATNSATEDALATLAALAAWWAITSVARLERADQGQLLALVLAGMLVGVATGIRPSLILLAIPLVWVLARRPARPAWHWGLLAVPVAAGYLIAVPYAVAELPALLNAGGAALRQYGFGADRSIALLLWQQAPVAAGIVARRESALALTAGLGLLTALTFRFARNGKWTWEPLPHTGLLLSYLLPAGVLFALQLQPSARLLLPIEPFLALLGGQFLTNSWVTARRPRRLRIKSS